MSALRKGFHSFREIIMGVALAVIAIINKSYVYKENIQHVFKREGEITK